MSVNIVKDALEAYDANNDKYENIKKKIKYVRFVDEDQEDIQGVKFVFFDKDKKELFTSRIEILGVYFNTINTWVWGWGLPGIDKAVSTIIRKVFLYGTDIYIRDKSSNSENIMLKNELITSRFRIVDEAQIEIHCAIASYLAKKPLIFMWKEFLPTMNDYYEVKGEYWKGDTTITYYTFIVDPPVV